MTPYDQLMAKYQEALEVTLLLTQKLTEEKIDDVLLLIDKRESIINELKLLVKAEEASPEFNPIIHQIIEQDKTNQGLMFQQKLKLQLELRKFNQAKQAKQGYEPSYSPDAIFFDKKK